MCGVVTALLCLYCRSGCRASVVASALTFHPPDPPYYDFDYDPVKDEYNLALADEVPAIPFSNYTSHVIITKQNTCVPIVCLRHPDAKFTIIHSHGNATDIGAMFLVYTMMTMSLRVNVVGYDYSGYGVSNIIGSKHEIEGTSLNHHRINQKTYRRVNPTEDQTYHDIEAVYNWCMNSKLVIDPAKEIILYGQSVGSGPSCYLASKSKVAGLVLHSPIMSGLRVMTNSRLLACWDIYPNINRIELVKSPVFIIHGQEDREVICAHGTQLYERVAEGLKTPPWWVPKKGHNDVLQGNESEFIRRMRAFIEIVEQHVQSPVIIDDNIPKLITASSIMIRDVSVEDSDNTPQSF